MLAKGPPASHNSLKITLQKTLLKMFSTSTYLMAQLWCRSKIVQMSQKMASQPPRVDTPN
jgi:hypothetical protein